MSPHDLSLTGIRVLEEHTDEVLAEAGLTRDEIAALHVERVIA